MSETPRDWQPGQVRICCGARNRRSKRQVLKEVRTITADLSGPFAIHRSVMGDGRSVTHVPTGYEIVEAVTPEAAREFVAAVASLMDWEAAKPGPLPPEIKDAVIEAWWCARGAMFVDRAHAARASEARP